MKSVNSRIRDVLSLEMLARLLTRIMRKWLPRYLEERYIAELDRRLDQMGMPKEKRIGIFGATERKEVIFSIARYISEKLKMIGITGWEIFTNDSIYEWDSVLAEIVLQIFPLIPPLSAKYIRDNIIVDPLYYQYLPMLCSRAIVDLTEIGAQVFEILGCYLANIPMLGFIQVDNEEFGGWLSKIENEPPCDNIKIGEAEKYIECICLGKGKCPKRQPNECIFIRPGLRWSVRQLFFSHHHILIVSPEIPFDVIRRFLIRSG